MLFEIVAFMTDTEPNWLQIAHAHCKNIHKNIKIYAHLHRDTLTVIVLKKKAKKNATYSDTNIILYSVHTKTVEQISFYRRSDILLYVRWC